MYCRNCGTKLEDGQRFCGTCGAKNVDETPANQAPNTQYHAPNTQYHAPNAQYQAPNAQYQAPRVQPQAQSPVGRNSFLGKYSDPIAILYMVTALLFLLQFLFFFVSAVKISYFGVSASLFEVAKEIDGGLAFIIIPIIGLDIASFVLCVLPVVMRTWTQRRRLVCAKISGIYLAFWLIMLFVEILDEGGGYVSLTVGGVLLILFSVALIVLPFVITHMVKKGNNTRL